MFVELRCFSLAVYRHAHLLYQVRSDLYFLAHLWGAYAIPLALSVVRLPSSIVPRVSSVSTITTRNNEAIKSIYSTNVYHGPGLCLLGIGGAPYISHKIMARKPYFHIFDFFS